MTTRFDQQGTKVPVTAILAEPNVLLNIVNDKAQIGMGIRKKVKKPQSNLANIAGFAPRFVKEVAIVQKEESPAIGAKLTVEIFKAGDKVKISGVTKGKGFAGGMKRWGFHGGPKTHGQSDRHRAPGSIGQTTTPGRVFKGKKMAGHMGAANITVTGLEVVDVDAEKNIILVKGAVPGARNSLLLIQKTGESKKHIPLFGKQQPTPLAEPAKTSEAQEEADLPQAVIEPFQNGNVDKERANASSASQVSEEVKAENTAEVANDKEMKEDENANKAS